MQSQKVKQTLRAAVRKGFENNRIWEAVPDWAKDQDFLRVQRSVALENLFVAHCDRAFKDSSVLSGPFEGLIVPQVRTQGCAAFPRLLGSYESELHTTLERMIKRNPPLVIDIGFAEGYYLVGLGKRLAQANLVGFDISREAHDLCLNLSEANHVNPSRIELLEVCRVDSLSKYLPAKSLVLCDCEGFEKDLFAAAPKELWASSNLIVECHDFISLGAEESVQSALEETHKIRIIKSVKTQQKLPSLSHSRFQEFSQVEKMRLLEEGRPCEQHWIVAEPVS